MPQVTVIIPTYDHGALLRHSLGSVLAQRFTDFQVVVIGDGIPAAVLPTVRTICTGDRRVRLVERPKGGRTGEPWRDEVLRGLDTPLVCYMTDDDLWLVDHLERLVTRLGQADFVHAPVLAVTPEGEVRVYKPYDLAQPFHRHQLANRRCRASLAAVGHTLEAYLRLPEGWSETPADRATDVHMWMKWGAQPWVRFACTGVPSVLKLSSLKRPDWNAREREDELARWAERTRGEEGRLRLLADAWPAVQQAWLTTSIELDRLHIQLGGISDLMDRGALAEFRAARAERGGGGKTRRRLAGEE